MRKQTKIQNYTYYTHIKKQTEEQKKLKQEYVYVCACGAQRKVNINIVNALVVIYIWKQICKLKKLNQEIRYTHKQKRRENKYKRQKKTLGATHILSNCHTQSEATKRWKRGKMRWKEWEWERESESDWKRIVENVVCWKLSIRNQLACFSSQFCYFLPLCYTK